MSETRGVQATVDNDTRTDFTGYAALIGESFQSRIDLLGRLLQTRHYPSLGTYKERLLADTVRKFLPQTVSVGTGFVLFPCEDKAPPAEGRYFDSSNQSAFDVSRQCDIIVYDGLNYSPVFQDMDFVVLRPESVKAVIEVKSRAAKAEVESALESFLDFSRKWQCTQRFYRDHHQTLSPDPQLHCFCWNSGRSARSKHTGQVLRELVAGFYRERVSLDQFGALPLLYSLSVYNDWEISEIQGLSGAEGNYINQVGWYSRRGRFVRVDERGELYLDRDRTIASLLAHLQWITSQDKFNRFFAYPDEVKGAKDHDVEESGITWAWETSETDPIRRRNTDSLSD
jgi:hypothetical protein